MTKVKVGVVGCGLMGSGIAEVCIKSGHETIVREINQELLEAGLNRLRGSLEKVVARGKMTAEERDAVLGLLEQMW